MPSRSRSERDDSQYRIAVHQGFGNLVDRTVASDSQHVGELLLYRLPGNLGGVAGITCNPENDIEMGLVKSGCDLLGDIFFRLRAGNGIDDDANASLFHSFNFIQK